MKMKTICTCAAAVAALLVAGTTVTTAASPNWVWWNVTRGSAVRTGDTVSAGGRMVITLVLNGMPLRTECRFPTSEHAFTHTVTATDTLSAAPGARLVMPFRTAPTLSSASHTSPVYDRCQDTSGTTFGSGTPYTVTTPGAKAPFSITTRKPGIPGIYSGVAKATLVFPAKAFTLWQPSWGCGFTFPLTATPVQGTYDTATGSFRPTDGQPLSGSATKECTVRNIEIHTSSLSLDPLLSMRY